MCSLETQLAEPEVVFLPVEEPPAQGEVQVPTYYEMPSLKKSSYHWKTALSFLAEATGGGPQFLAEMIHLAGNAEDRGLVRAGRYLGLAGALAGPGLLVSELHTPGRWLHMLRIFRPTSPMSIGNLSLTSFGVFSGLIALGQLLEDLGRRRGRLVVRTFQIPAALTGAMICLYPGTELEETSVALWAGSHPLMSPLFAANGLSAGAAALTLAAQGGNVPEASRDRLNRLAVLILAVQLGQALMVERAWRRHGFPSLRKSSRGSSYRLLVMGLGIAVPLALRLLPGGDSGRRQENRTVAAATSLAGSYLVYEAVLEAGNLSAASASDYLGETRVGPARPQKSRVRTGVLGLALLTMAGAAYFLRKRRSSWARKD